MKLAQTDNGLEFVNNQDKTSNRTQFEKELKKLGIDINELAPIHLGKME